MPPSKKKASTSKEPAAASRGKARKVAAAESAAAAAASSVEGMAAGEVGTPDASASKPRRPVRTKGTRPEAEADLVLGLTAEQRHRMIEEAAYFKFLQRGYTLGNPEDDWFAAEAEVDLALASLRAKNDVSSMNH